MHRHLSSCLLLVCLAACDSAAEIPNAAPSLAGVDALACADALCEVHLRVVDPDGDPVDLDIACVGEDGSPCTLRDEAGGDGSSGLVPDRALPGRAHVLLLRVDGASPGSSVRLRLTPIDSHGLAGPAQTTELVTL